MTGGATGIGAAVRAQLEKAGHRVIVVDIKEADIIADLSNDEGRAKAIEGISERAPDGLDGFVPCAGVGGTVTPASLVTRINYFGTVVLAAAMKSRLAKKRGCMVLISSNSAPMTKDEEFVNICLSGDEAAAIAHSDANGDSQAAYAGAKMALTRWMRRNSTDYAKDGVRMNAVAPGMTRTPLTEAVMRDEKLGPAIKAFRESIPVGEIGVPDQIANIVTFLLSPEASFVCGSVFFADGGHDAMLRPDSF